MNEKDIKQARKIMVSKATNALEIIQEQSGNIQDTVKFDPTHGSPMPRIKDIEVALGKIQKQVSELNALDGAMGMLAEIEEAKK